MMSFLRPVAALTVVAVLSATSCGDDDDEAQTTTDPPSEERSDDADTATGPPAGEGFDDAGVRAARSIATDCPDDYDELRPATARPDEMQYLNDITVCTSRGRSRTFIKNDSDAAWTIITARGGEKVDQLTNTLDHQVFREEVALVYRSAVLAPYSEVKVHANPSTVTWTLSPGLSAMWLAHTKIAEAGKGFFKDLAVRALSRGSPWRNALVTCSVDVYKQAGALGEFLDSQNPADQLFGLVFKGLNVASELTPCVEAMHRADDDAARATGKVTLTDDITRSVVNNRSFLQRANSTLSRLKQFGQQILTVVFRAPRVPG
jgi:hypothetical protein